MVTINALISEGDLALLERRGEPGNNSLLRDKTQCHGRRTMICGTLDKWTFFV